MKRKLYDIVVDEDGETGMDFNSFVENPAHGMNFIQFGKVQKFHFNNEKRIITGVAIAADVIIPRYDEKTKEEYDVIFPAETIEIIRNKWFKNGYNNNLNLEHHERRLPKGVYMVESYLVSNDNKNQVKPPEVFSKLNLQNGSWILSYYVENDDVWKRAKNGEFNGFSIEILSELKVNNKNKKSKMKKKKVNFWSKRQKFNSAKTVDSIVYFDGELNEGTVIYSDEEMTTPVTDLSLVIQVGESFKTIELNGEGVVTTVADAESFNEETADAVETVEEELVDEVVQILDEVSDDSTLEEVAESVVEAVIDVIAEADEEEFATFKKFANHKILAALKLAREAKEEAPKRKFSKPKSKTNGKPNVEQKRTTFADLRKKINK